jgi:hypothetical protein
MITIMPSVDDEVGGLVALVIFALFGLTTLDLLALQTIYIVHAATSDRVRREHKALWVALLLLVNLIVMPVYWYLHMWKQPKLPRYEPGAQVLG